MVLAKGAGAEMRRMLGTAVFSGMIGVTLFGILLTPVFFISVDGLRTWTNWRFPWLQRYTRYVLWIFSFGYARAFVHMMSRLRDKRQAASKDQPPTNSTNQAN